MTHNYFVKFIWLLICFTLVIWSTVWDIFGVKTHLFLALLAFPISIPVYVVGLIFFLFFKSFLTPFIGLNLKLEYHLILSLAVIIAGYWQWFVLLSKIPHVPSLLQSLKREEGLFYASDGLKNEPSNGESIGEYFFKQLKYLFLLFILSSSTHQDNTIRFVDDDFVPLRPSMLSYFTIFGEDDDHDGVRDDIELYINRNFEDPNYRKALKYEAKSLDKYMRAKKSSEINNIFYGELDDAKICTEVIRKILNASFINIEDKIINNPWRREYQNRQGRMLKIQDYHHPKSVVAQLKKCHFDFVNIQSTLRPFLEKYNYKTEMDTEETKELEEIMRKYNN